jgi:hypothetical protein
VVKILVSLRVFSCSFVVKFRFSPSAFFVVKFAFPLCHPRPSTG